MSGCELIAFTIAKKKKNRRYSPYGKWKLSPIIFFRSIFFSHGEHKQNAVNDELDRLFEQHADVKVRLNRLYEILALRHIE